MSKKYLPIWLEDTNKNKYHVKVNKDGLPYIVDAYLHKSLFLPNIEHCSIGHQIEHPLFYNTYTVTRNEKVS